MNISPDCPGTRRHGTHVAYKRDGCRCPEAARAANLWQKQYELDIIAGRPRKVPSIGTVRRLRALMRIGWTKDYMAERLGYSGPSRLRQFSAQPMVSASVARRVADLYAELQDHPGPSRITASKAAARGYPPPIAWDDDQLDDPAAEPSHWERTGSRVRSADRVEDINWLRRHGASDEQIAERLGVRPSSIATYLARAAA